MQIEFFRGYRCCWILLSLFFLSCNKELDDQSDPIAAIRGEWIFMSNAVTTESVTTYTLDGIVYRNKMTADYVTYNNNGKVIISDKSMIGEGIRFDVITDAFFTFYIGDDNEEDSVPVAFNHYMDSAYTLQRSFQLIGTDSVYFTEGTLMRIPDINGEERTSMDLPQGGTIRWFDQSMTITTYVEDEYSYAIGETTYQVVKKERVVTNLTKPF